LSKEEKRRRGSENAYKRDGKVTQVKKMEGVHIVCLTPY
jgi:hypothetical protein